MSRKQFIALLVALVVLVAATVAVWMSRQDAGAAGDGRIGKKQVDLVVGHLEMLVGMGGAPAVQVILIDRRPTGHIRSQFGDDVIGEA